MLHKEKSDMIDRKSLSYLSIDEILGEALHREAALLSFYTEIQDIAGFESTSLVTQFCEQQKDRIKKINRLLDEIHELRELTGAIAG